MRTIRRYRFELQCGDNSHTAYPLYDKLTKKWKQESNNIFFRYELQGQLQFVNEDFDFIIGCDMAEDILLTIYRDGKKYLDCYFRLADCEVDVDHKSIKVQPKSKDAYNAILDKYNEEYNLMSHNPKLSDVAMDVRPMLQVYELGADYVNNYIGSNYHKTSVTPLNSLQTGANSYLKFQSTTICKADIIQSMTDLVFGLLTGVSLYRIGDWVALGDSANTHLIELSHRVYKLVFKSTQTVNENNGNWAIRIFMQCNIQNVGWRTIALYKYSDNQQWLTLEQLYSLKKLTLYEYNADADITTNVIYYEIDLHFNSLASRICVYTNSDDSNVDENDTFLQSEIYNKVMGYSIDTLVVSSGNTSSITTQWGKVWEDQDVYYVPASNEEDYHLYEPVLQSLWGDGLSFWLKIYSTTSYIEEVFTKSKTLKDWVSVYEVLRVLLEQVDPSIQIRHDSVSSVFMWGVKNPITGLDKQGEMFMLAKSNATKLEYDYSATKTPIKISDILDWLKTINVYWDIVRESDGNKYLRLEHLSFYMNGESYDKNVYKHISLKDIYDIRNTKNYAYRTNHWKYEDMDSMPTTLFYKWADTVSMLFEGEAMKAVKRLGDERQETRTAGVFTSDIDYVFANSNSINKDGFIVVQAYKSDGDTAYKIQYYDDEINGRQYHLQNGLLSAIYFQKNYLNYDLAFKQAEVTGGAIVDVKQMKRIRYNEVEFFVPQGVEVDEYTQLTTEAGRGTISDMEQDMSSDKIKTTLKYPIYNED